MRIAKMIKVEAKTLELAYEQAANRLECSITELQIEVVQHPSSGFLGLFKKEAIIIASSKVQLEDPTSEQEPIQKEPPAAKSSSEAKKEPQYREDETSYQELHDNTLAPSSFVTTQEDEDYSHYTYEEDDEAFYENAKSLDEIASEVEDKINALFKHICFNLDRIKVRVFDENTLEVEFSGEDAALLIGKEGYRYKALSYIIFNWINAEYQLQLRMEIAEFLQNQEESISRYLVGVCENIDRDGRAQTKVLDGVLVQIALKELRARYPQKYVAIRSTRDGAKYIIVNDYNEY